MKKRTDIEAKILSYLKKHKNVSINQLSLSIGINYRSVWLYTYQLEKAKKVKLMVFPNTVIVNLSE